MGLEGAALTEVLRRRFWNVCMSLDSSQARPPARPGPQQPAHGVASPRPGPWKPWPETGPNGPLPTGDGLSVPPIPPRVPQAASREGSGALFSVAHTPFPSPGPSAAGLAFASQRSGLLEPAPELGPGPQSGRAPLPPPGMKEVMRPRKGSCWGFPGVKPGHSWLLPVRPAPPPIIHVALALRGLILPTRHRSQVTVRCKASARPPSPPNCWPPEPRNHLSPPLLPELRRGPRHGPTRPPAPEGSFLGTWDRANGAVSVQTLRTSTHMTSLAGAAIAEPHRGQGFKP